MVGSTKAYKVMSKLMGKRKKKRKDKSQNQKLIALPEYAPETNLR